MENESKYKGQLKYFKTEKGRLAISRANRKYRDKLKKIFEAKVQEKLYGIKSNTCNSYSNIRID